MSRCLLVLLLVCAGTSLCHAIKANHFHHFHELEQEYEISNHGFAMHSHDSAEMSYESWQFRGNMTTSDNSGTISGDAAISNKSQRSIEATTGTEERIFEERIPDFLPKLEDVRHHWFIREVIFVVDASGSQYFKGRSRSKQWKWDWELISGPHIEAWVSRYRSLDFTFRIMFVSESLKSHFHGGRIKVNDGDFWTKPLTWTDLLKETEVGIPPWPKWGGNGICSAALFIDALKDAETQLSSGDGLVLGMTDEVPQIQKLYSSPRVHLVYLESQTAPKSGWYFQK